MAEQPQQQPAEESFFGNLLNQLPRMIMIYFAIQYFTQSSNPTTNNVDNNVIKNQESIEKPLSNSALQSSWALGQIYSLNVFLDPEFHFNKFDQPSALLWKEDGLKFGDFADIRTKDFVLPCSKKIQNNGSLYAHLFLAKQDLDLTALDVPTVHSMSLDGTILYHRKLLTRYKPKQKVIKVKKLINNQVDESEEEEIDDSKADRPIISYWYQNLSLHTIAMDDNLPAKQPPKIAEYLSLDSKGKYLPIFYVNDFWMLSENLMPINETVSSLNLTISYSLLSFWKFQLYVQFDESFRIQTEVMGADPKEAEQMKRMFIDTNPILLAITFCVSLLHSVFDFLAFKNDISFWKDKKNMEGISFRTIVVNIIFQSIILLYLMDNDTSYLILVSSSVGLVIEIWKINKTVIIKKKDTFPYLEFQDRVKPSKLSAKTQKYDRMAFQYLSYVVFPVFLAYTVYSLQYEKHKSWYSFVIGTLVGFVYTFGFISMTPQLFINYKLKSVAHMPWKTFIYKALNTFIDDLFAFVIKMPWLHRLACLRDDAVFLVYLYQRWIYKEDKRRRNEFGQVGESVTKENDDESSDDEGEEKELMEEKANQEKEQVIKESEKETTTRRRKK